MIRVKEGGTRGKGGRTRKRRFIGLREELSKEALKLKSKVGSTPTAVPLVQN